MMKVTYPNRDYKKLKDVEKGALCWFSVDGCAMIKTDKMTGDKIVCVDLHTGSVYEENKDTQVCLFDSELIIKS
tara:strand:- start:194 stop:415 length:222 start_codon:yes stop_codon:yes gene_type:complete